jgi:hypothetical protein
MGRILTRRNDKSLETHTHTQNEEFEALPWRPTFLSVELRLVNEF